MSNERRVGELIDLYEETFGELPPMKQVDLSQAEELLQRAIDRGEKLRDDELLWPSSPNVVM